MSRSNTSPLGYGLYFIDVLACLLFCIALALVSARFSRERTVDVSLPALEMAAAPGGATTAPSIVIRSGEAGAEFFLEDRAVSLEELAEQLRETPPPAVVVRSEESALSQVIAVAHEAGVHDIQLAYELRRPGESTSREGVSP